jgi:hypothetical protein
MHYLKFLSQRAIPPLGDYFQSNMTFVIIDSSENDINFENNDVKIVEIRLSGREDASLRARYANFNLDSAFFTIAKNYLIKKIEMKEKIRDKEKLYSDASAYLNLDITPLEKYHNEIIKVVAE